MTITIPRYRITTLGPASWFVEEFGTGWWGMGKADEWGPAYEEVAMHGIFKLERVRRATKAECIAWIDKERAHILGRIKKEEDRIAHVAANPPLEYPA
jgi:hypothetical protein